MSCSKQAVRNHTSRILNLSLMWRSILFFFPYAAGRVGVGIVDSPSPIANGLFPQYILNCLLSAHSEEISTNHSGLIQLKRPSSQEHNNSVLLGAKEVWIKKLCWVLRISWGWDATIAREPDWFLFLSSPFPLGLHLLFCVALLLEK